MKTTLEKLLRGQDLNSAAICQKILEDKPVDSLTQVIVDAWNQNGGPQGEFDSECFEADINYAISQLKKVLKNLPVS